ncbi:unnamed protein product [Amoebophrya sp. A120]|nr:unnamed protein product [Amoebophrya sp. A120]|eukprot:GSA120T00003286001.1
MLGAGFSRPYAARVARCVAGFAADETALTRAETEHDIRLWEDVGFDSGRPITAGHVRHLLFPAAPRADRGSAFGHGPAVLSTLLFAVNEAEHALLQAGFSPAFAKKAAENASDPSLEYTATVQCPVAAADEIALRTMATLTAERVGGGEDGTLSVAQLRGAVRRAVVRQQSREDPELAAVWADRGLSPREVEQAFLSAGVTPAYARRLGRQVGTKAVPGDSRLVEPGDARDKQILSTIGLDFALPESVARVRGFFLAVEAAAPSKDGQTRVDVSVLSQPSFGNAEQAATLGGFTKAMPARTRHHAPARPKMLCLQDVLDHDIAEAQEPACACCSCCGAAGAGGGKTADPEDDSTSFTHDGSAAPAGTRDQNDASKPAIMATGGGAGYSVAGAKRGAGAKKKAASSHKRLSKGGRRDGASKGGSTTSSAASSSSSSRSSEKDASHLSHRRTAKKSQARGTTSSKQSTASAAHARSPEQEAQLNALAAAAAKALEEVGFPAARAKLLAQRVAQTDTADLSDLALDPEDQAIAEAGLGGKKIRDLHDLVDALVEQKKDFFDEVAPPEMAEDEAEDQQAMLLHNTGGPQPLSILQTRYHHHVVRKKKPAHLLTKK